MWSGKEKKTLKLEGCAFILKRQGFFFLSFSPLSNAQAVKYCSELLFFFSNLGWLWVSSFILIFYVYPSVVRTDCQPQGFLLVEVGCISHRVHSHGHMPSLLDDEESPELLRGKALMRPQRSRDGHCLPIVVRSRQHLRDC